MIRDHWPKDLIWLLHQGICKALLVGIFLLSLPVLNFGQGSEIDSLMARLQSAENDSVHWEVLKRLADAYRKNNQDSAYFFTQQTLDFAQKKYPDKIGPSHTHMANYYLEFHEYDKANEHLYQALELSEQQNCIPCKIDALNAFAELAMLQEDYSKAIGRLLEAKKLAEQLDDRYLVAKSAVNLAWAQSEAGQHDAARQFALEALGIGRELGNEELQLYCFNNLGLIEMSLERFPNAINYFQQVEPLALNSDDLDMLAVSYCNIGQSYFALSNIDSSEYYYEAALPLIEQLDEKSLLANYYYFTSQILESKGDLKKAMAHLRQSVVINDSLRTLMYSETMAEAEAQYKTKEKEAELAKKDLELERQNALRNRIIGGALALLLLVAAVFQYFRYRDQLRKREAELALQLEQAEAGKLRELDQLKSSFFANISHEFRTPLTLIDGPLRDLQSADFKGDVKKYYRLMRRNTKRLLSLVNQLLDLSKLESGHMKLQVREDDIGRFTLAIANSFESLAITRQIDYQVQVPEKPIKAWFDRDKLEKILSNLLSNAFKFTPEEGEIELIAEVRDDSFEIVLNDSGIGISEDQLPNIFDRFYQVDTSNSQDKMEQRVGSGIGLALTKELVELHHGNLRVESKLGQGTSFSLSIPLGKNHWKESEIITLKPPMIEVDEVATPVIVSTLGKDRGMREDHPCVLVVEDNTEVRQYIKEQLVDSYQVEEANNGKIGFDKAVELVPDLILSDVMMPVMDGIELLKALLQDERTSHIPVIMLTAKAAQEDKLVGLDQGAHDYLVKPFDGRELNLRIRNLIDQRQKLQAKFDKKTVRLSAKQVAVSSLDEQFLKKLMDAIETNLDEEDFGVVELAEKVHLSRHQLHRKLKALTGLSPSVFIRNLRLERAKQLLEQKAGNASEVAFMVGFNSAAYFSKCFSDKYGFPPSELRHQT